jgi:hypothetical protein
VVEEPARVAGEVVRRHRHGLPELADDDVQGRPEERFLVAEVDVDRALVRLGGRGDAVDARSREPVGGELVDGGEEDAGPGGLSVTSDAAMLAAK